VGTGLAQFLVAGLLHISFPALPSPALAEIAPYATNNVMVCNIMMIQATLCILFSIFELSLKFYVSKIAL